MKYINRIFAGLFLCTLTIPAYAYQYDMGRTTFDLTGYGTLGILEPKFENPEIINDWRVRSTVNFHATGATTIGAVYSIDAIAIDENRAVADAFGLIQNKDIGRLELGLTSSVAQKLGLGLPDVGGLRVNDRPLFYKKIHPAHAVIADTTLNTGRRAPRANFVSNKIGNTQIGVSVSGLDNDYDYAVDVGLKIRQSDGKLKSAFSIAASFMDTPNGFSTDTFTPTTTADWRTQFSAGMNIQYNSWIWALTARAIYDHNPIGVPTDGLAFGTGVSYDLLNYSISLSYILSETGIWRDETPRYLDNTVIGSFRYKYSENITGWASIGLTSETPFVAAGMAINF